MPCFGRTPYPHDGNQPRRRPCCRYATVLFCFVCSSAENYLRHNTQLRCGHNTRSERCLGIYWKPHLPSPRQEGLPCPRMRPQPWRPREDNVSCGCNSVMCRVLAARSCCASAATSLLAGHQYRCVRVDNAPRAQPPSRYERNGPRDAGTASRGPLEVGSVRRCLQGRILFHSHRC